jgi:selenocysteine-specific elongation factor
MAIIGTAGHIDHGKSALIQALTAIDPDRLPEEKRREMTIDLGFAWLPLSSGEMVGIVDVPGHEDFIRNMIAGVGGIDAAILVIAQDEGWMPQTEEHLRILDLLGVKHGIVALTKIDLNDDPHWLDLVEEEIRDKMRGTGLSDAPIVRVSARLGTNIAELRQRIDEMVARVPPKRDIGKPRLPIDRVFSIKGSGVVITGTLMDGTLARGGEIYIFPKDLRARIRTVESYKEKLDRAQPGTRVALNLTGLEKEDLVRGDVIFGDKEQAKSSRIIDVQVQLIPQLFASLKSNTEYKIYLGTRELSGQVVLLGRESIKAGESGFAQFRFKEPAATRLGEHFIIRRVSPSQTIGGGVVLNPAASRHKYKNIPGVTRSLERRAHLKIDDLILLELEERKYIEEKDLLIASHYSTQDVARCVESLKTGDKLVRATAWTVDLTYWQKISAQVLDILAREHSLHPLEKGLPQAELESRLRLPKGLFSQLITTLINSGKIARRESIIALLTHRPSLAPQQEKLVADILNMLKADPANPPTRKEILASLPGSETVIRYLYQQGLAVELPDGLLFERQYYEKAKDKVIGFLEKNGAITIQQVRDLLGFSRKYIIPLLNKLEEEGIIRRRGEERILIKKQARPEGE